MTEKPKPSPFVEELYALWSRYYLFTAQRRVVDLVLEHYDDLVIPHPSRSFLYQTALDAMILDLVVLWDVNGKGSLVSVAKRLTSTPEQDLAAYVGRVRSGQDAREAGRFIDSELQKISPTLAKLITARNKTIAHLDRPDSQQPFSVGRDGIDSIQTTSLGALKNLTALVDEFPPVGGELITAAGENLVQDLRRSTRGDN
ncbi:MAG: hypothetical protein IPP14_09550 [Planctomycetes bacterium]|nr:hypothetical protein [Planctomycetota bacterium]